jgi:hypothetical protein
MPAAAHRALEKEAKKKGLKGKRKDAYVYGTLNKIETAKAAYKPK